MFIRSTDTTVNMGTKTNNTQTLLLDAINTLKVHGESQFITIQSGINDDHVVLGYGEGPDNRIKPFFNPVTVNDGTTTYLIVDIRNCTRWDRADDKPVVTNTSLFRREVVRTLLEDVWVEGGSNTLLNLSNYQITVYATWIAEIFARRFGLDAEQQLRISVLAGFFYLCQFTDNQYMDVRRTILILSKACMVNATFVNETLEGIEYIATISDFLTSVQELLQSERLKGVDLQVFLAMLSGSWFGANNAQLVAIAVEYPPTWNALLYLSMTDRVNRSNGIAKVAIRRERDTNARDYVAAMSRLLMQESSINPKEIKGGL